MYKERPMYTVYDVRAIFELAHRCPVKKAARIHKDWDYDYSGQYEEPHYYLGRAQCPCGYSEKMYYELYETWKAKQGVPNFLDIQGCGHTDAVVGFQQALLSCGICMRAERSNLRERSEDPFAARHGTIELEDDPPGEEFYLWCDRDVDELLKVRKLIATESYGVFDYENVAIDHANDWIRTYLYEIRVDGPFERGVKNSGYFHILVHTETNIRFATQKRRDSIA